MERKLRLFLKTTERCKTKKGTWLRAVDVEHLHHTYVVEHCVKFISVKGELWGSILLVNNK